MLQIAWSSAVSVRDQQKSTPFYICIKIQIKSLHIVIEDWNESRKILYQKW